MTTSVQRPLQWVQPNGERKLLELCDLCTESSVTVFSTSLGEPRQQPCSGQNRVEHSRMGHFGSFSCSSALVDVQALNQKDIELKINSFAGVICCDCLPNQTRCLSFQLDFYSFLQKFEMYFEI